MTAPPDVAARVRIHGLSHRCRERGPGVDFRCLEIFFRFPTQLHFNFFYRIFIMNSWIRRPAPLGALQRGRHVPSAVTSRRGGPNQGEPPAPQAPEERTNTEPFGSVVLRLFLCFTCPAITVGTVILRALDRVRERALGCFTRWCGCFFGVRLFYGFIGSCERDEYSS